MSAPYSTVWVVTYDMGIHGESLPEVGFTTEEEANEYIKDHKAIANVTELEIFKRAKDAE